MRARLSGLARNRGDVLLRGLGGHDQVGGGVGAGEEGAQVGGGEPPLEGPAISGSSLGRRSGALRLGEGGEVVGPTTLRWATKK